MLSNLPTMGGAGTGVAAAVLALALASPVAAQNAGAPSGAATFCAPRAYRWQDDCRALAGAELHGIDQLRYRPLTKDGEVWLTLGGEARTRMDLLHDIDFGINDQPGYTMFAGRLLVNADVRSRSGPRAFVQLGVVQETGRKPAPRGQDESGLDVTQAFVETPWSLARAQGLVRVGRQELDLSGNRLVSSRDGATLRRAFQGAKVDVRLGGANLALLSVHPMELRDEPFSDRPDGGERFRAASLDLPRGVTPGGGALNLFLFERERETGRYLRAAGREHRYTYGAHYAVADLAGWQIDAQAAWQTGKVQGLPVRAYGLGLQLDHELGGPANLAVGFDMAVASGDRARTARIETFDPLYPNNGGLSDAPLIYQTNYMFGGGGLSSRWAGTTWTAGANLLVRHSGEDAIYANNRPIMTTYGRNRLTSVLAQVSARRPFGRHFEIYGSLVRGESLKGLKQSGGHDAIYSRVQLTARF